MKMTNELRVGILFFSGLILLIMLIVTMTRWGQDHGSYSFTIRFLSAQGIAGGASVRLSGVKIGQVFSVTIDKKTNEALVNVHVKKDVHLYKNFSFTIGIDGMVGERYVEIMPTPQPGEMIAAGDVTQGGTTGDINSLVSGANTIVTKLSATADALNSLIGSPEIQQNLLQASSNIAKTTAQAADLTTSLNVMLRRNESDIDGLVADLHNIATGLSTVSSQLADSHFVGNLADASANTVKLTARLNNIAGTVETLVADPELKTSMHQVMTQLTAASTSLEKTLADVQLASAGLPQAIANVNKASADLPIITGNFSRAAADLPSITDPMKKIMPETTSNILDISQQLRHTSDTIGGIAGGLSKTISTISSLKMQPEARIVPLTGGNPSMRSDVNLDIHTTKDLLRLGLADIGGRNSINAQFGTELKDRLWFRYGLVQSRFGLGMDYQAGHNLTISGEMFDPSSMRVNALLDYRLKSLGKSWWLTTGVYDLFDGNRLGLGLTYRP